MGLIINGKPIEILATAAITKKYGEIELGLYIKTILAIIPKYFYDMYVFEMTDETHFQVRLAGCDLKGDKGLDEKTICFHSESLPIETFWCKIDDYGDKYIGTLLFPSDW